MANLLDEMWASQIQKVDHLVAKLVQVILMEKEMVSRLWMAERMDLLIVTVLTSWMAERMDLMRLMAVVKGFHWVLAFGFQWALG